MKKVAGIRNLDLVAVMHGVPRPLLAFRRDLHLVHRILGNLVRHVAIERRARPADLIENAIGEPDVHAGIRLGIPGLEDDANLAVAEAFPAVDEQTETSWI